MTTRLLILGNSHIRALRDALSDAPEKWDSLDVTTFGFRGAAVPEIAVDGGALVPTGDFARQQFEALNQGQSSCALGGYDAIVVAGFDFKPLDAVALSRAATWPGLPSLSAAEDIATLRQTMMSEGGARAALESALAHCDASRLVRMIRDATEADVFVVPCPRLNVKAKWTDVPRFFGHGRAIKQGDAETLGRMWEQAARRVCRQIGARYLPQPRETISEHLLTSSDFMAQGTVTLPTAKGPRKVPDLTHANGAYGALVLQRLRKKLAA